MNTTIKPMWREGLFMMPQHLQLMDSFHEQLLDHRVNSLVPYPWGIHELEFEEEELARGHFSLSKCRGVMPDGMLIQLGEGKESRGLTAAINTTVRNGERRNIDVFLAIPSSKVGGVSAAGAGSSGTRYVQSLVMIPDQFGSAPDAEIDGISPNFRLLVGQEDQQNFITIKIAELTLEESGQLVLSDHYVPPCLKIRVSSPLMKRLARLVAAMGAKQKDLADKYNTRSSAMIEFGSSDVATFLYLHTINAWLPIFMHYAHSGEVHPEGLYLALASFAGQLTSFDTTNPDALDIPRFNYLDLAATFFPLFDKVFKLLGSVVSNRYRTIPLEQTQPGLFIARLDDPQILRAPSFYLLMGGDMSEDLLRNDVPRYIKVGSVDQISKIVHSALPGVGVFMDHSPPAGIPVRSHMVYLRLEKQGRYWDSVLQSGTLAIYQPVKPERVKLELIALEA